MQSFPPEVCDKLVIYVYRLIDPRNGETFYIGSGKGNRVFVHIRDEIETDDLGEKLKRIHASDTKGDTNTTRDADIKTTPRDGRREARQSAPLCQPEV